MLSLKQLAFKAVAPIGSNIEQKQMLENLLPEMYVVSESNDHRVKQKLLESALIISELLDKVMENNNSNKFGMEFFLKFLKIHCGAIGIYERLLPNIILNR